MNYEWRVLVFRFQSLFIGVELLVVGWKYGMMKKGWFRNFFSQDNTEGLHKRPEESLHDFNSKFLHPPLSIVHLDKLSMKLLHSLGYAFEGLFSCFRTQRNFRIHMLAVIVVTVTGFALHLSGWEWVALVICMASVVALEMINTAIEQLCDLLHPGKHAVIKSVKDISAGAVLVAAGASIITAILIFLPHLS